LQERAVEQALFPDIIQGVVEAPFCIRRECLTIQECLDEPTKFLPNGRFDVVLTIPNAGVEDAAIQPDAEEDIDAEEEFQPDAEEFQPNAEEVGVLFLSDTIEEPSVVVTTKVDEKLNVKVLSMLHNYATVYSSSQYIILQTPLLHWKA
jgi:hypothetical protein